MANEDTARLGTDLRKRYFAVDMQQGRPITEDDWNENRRLISEDKRRAVLDIIGSNGSPDQGFDITDPVVTNGALDFQIDAGTLYVGGQRLEMVAPERFLLQSDWLRQSAAKSIAPPAPGTQLTTLAYLEAREQCVTAPEDSELFEPALGGPDTSTRLRMRRRVHLATTQDNVVCQDAWNALTASWSAAHLGTTGKSGERVVDTTLTVTPVPGTGGDLCNPPSAGGYLGAENQAIRVQLVDSSHFTWGFDNASPVYRVTLGTDENGSQTKITFMTTPKDQAHWPLQGMVVELLPWSSVLPNNEKIAEDSGFLTKVAASYDPDSQTLTLVDPVSPVGYGLEWQTRSDTRNLGLPFFFFRVWDRGSDLSSPAAIAFTPGTIVPLGTTGLAITINGSDAVAEDYWVIAARPATPELVVPWQLLTGEPPNGFRRFFAPLAVIVWTASSANVVSHCRNNFPPLTQVSGIDPGIHVLDVSSIERTGATHPLDNDSDVLASSILNGITVTCDTALDPRSVSRPTCFVTAEIPQQLQQQAIGYEAITLPADLTVADGAITWRTSLFPYQVAQLTALIPPTDRGLLTRLTLKGNFIRSTPDQPQALVLDGEAFGFATVDGRTALAYPSGDGRRGGDFGLWFWLRPVVGTLWVSIATDHLRAFRAFRADQPGEGDGPPQTILTKVARPTGIAVDRNGNVFVASTRDTGASIDVFAASATADDDPKYSISGQLTLLNSPRGIAVDSAGRLYVLNGDGSLLKFDSGARDNASPSAVLNFFKAQDVAVDANDKVYVLDSFSGGVAGGKILFYAPSPKTGDEPLTFIQSPIIQSAGYIAVDSRYIYYNDSSNFNDPSNLIAFDVNYAFGMPKYNVVGDLPFTSLSSGCSGIAADGAGNVYVVGHSLTGLTAPFAEVLAITVFSIGTLPLDGTNVTVPSLFIVDPSLGGVEPGFIAFASNF